MLSKSTVCSCNRISLYLLQLARRRTTANSICQSHGRVELLPLARLDVVFSEAPAISWLGFRIFRGLLCLVLRPLLPLELISRKCRGSHIRTRIASRNQIKMASTSCCSLARNMSRVARASGIQMFLMFPNCIFGRSGRSLYNRLYGRVSSANAVSGCCFDRNICRKQAPACSRLPVEHARPTGFKQRPFILT